MNGQLAAAPVLLHTTAAAAWLIRSGTSAKGNNAVHNGSTKQDAKTIKHKMVGMGCPIKIRSSPEFLYTAPGQNGYVPYFYRMQHQAKSIRPFIGARDFEVSRSFYRQLGFAETVLDTRLSVFQADTIAFYLQDAYVPDWVDNTMIFVEVDDVERYWKELCALELPQHYPGVRLGPIRTESWGRECFLHDPSGILWHFGSFA